MKRFWPLWALVGVLLLVGAWVFLDLHMRTKRECSKILALEGRTGNWSELAAAIKTSFTTIADPNEKEAILARLAVTNAEGLMVARFDGEGFPYYWGWVAYNTNTLTVVRTDVELLW